MSKLVRMGTCLLLALGMVFPARLNAQMEMASADLSEADIFQVVSASRLPQPHNQVPATVYVVTSDDINAYGAQTVWDVLRTVPGVDVSLSRTGQAEVSIRGLNKGQNNRTLVLLDGRSVLNGYGEHIFWEELPVNMEEIDRIEVVEGPASALYGANALSGVINIITKTPQQLKGGELSYSGGERKTHNGTVLFGDAHGPLSYKMSYGWRSANRFENADVRASEVGKAHALISYKPTGDSEVSVSAGTANTFTQVDTGEIGPYTQDGPVSFLRADARYHKTKFRSYWNRWRAFYIDNPVNAVPSIDINNVDASLEQSLSLPGNNEFTLGGSYRHIARAFSTISAKSVGQTWTAGFFEDQWKPLDRWTLLASGRWDHHPLAGTAFSPRGSVVFQPTNDHSFRASVGSAFRFPTIVENDLHIDTFFPNSPFLPFNLGIPNPPFALVDIQADGNHSLKPERLVNEEVGYQGRFGRVKTSLTGFHYRLTNSIQPALYQVVSANPATGVMVLHSSFENRGDYEAFGGEFGLDARVALGLNVFGNYSYQSIRIESPDNVRTNIALASPRHKVNGGVKYVAKGWASSIWADWVDTTWWSTFSTSTPVYEKVPSYALLNGHIGYTFQKHLKGLELGASVFNAANKKHYEMSPQVPNSGEIVKARWMGTVAYHF